MIRVGVTGGIGSGKTFVCKVFAKLGIPVFYADNIAKQLLNFDNNIRKDLIALFGADIYLSDGTIHRKKLANIIFNDQIALQKVNNIIHPMVRNEFNTWAEKQKSIYVIQEAAILFESKQTEHFDKIITVTAPIDQRINRVIKRDKLSVELIYERINNQISDEIKIKGSDYVINTEEKEMVLPQIINIHNSLNSYGKIW